MNDCPLHKEVCSDHLGHFVAGSSVLHQQFTKGRPDGPFELPQVLLRCVTSQFVETNRTRHGRRTLRGLSRCSHAGFLFSTHEGTTNNARKSVLRSSSSNVGSSAHVSS